MIFSDYPEISREDYKIPNGIPTEYMMSLAQSKNAFDMRVHDYLILVGSGKFTARQINRALYLTKYGAFRIRKKIKNDTDRLRKGCENISEKISPLQ